MNHANGWRGLFLNHIGQIRWMWRVLAFVLVYVVTAVAATSLTYALLPLPDGSVLLLDVRLTLNLISRAVAAVVVSWLVLSLIDKRRLASMGLHLHSSWRQELTFGMMVGGLMATSIGLGVWLVGGIRIELRSMSLIQAAGGLVMNGVLWFGMAAFYEVVFRGYLLQTVSEGLGKIAGTIIVSFIYATFLFTYVSANLWSATTSFLAAVMFSIAYFRTASLWSPLGLHFAWNFVQGYVLGSPVKADQTHFSIFKTTPEAWTWLSGSPQGVDGGIFGVVLVGVGLYYVSQTRHLLLSEDMRKIKYAALTTPFIRVAGRG